MDAFEQRLDALREEAKRTGTVSGSGVQAVGGPMPPRVPDAAAEPKPGYYGLPIIKPPVWEWMIAVYFFVGGLSGMSALLAMAAWNRGQLELARAAMWPAAAGAVLSPVLLTWDLGRPLRFLYMLRVFKYQSPMSVGSWIVFAFGVFALPGCALLEWQAYRPHLAHSFPSLSVLTSILVIGAGLAGIFLATYTGALLGVTTVPVWNAHRLILPFQFGMAGLGSAAGLLELTGFRTPALQAIGFFAAFGETLVLLWLELRRHGAVDQALHEGKSGWLLRAGEALAGPVPLVLRGFGLASASATAFLLGALVTRFGWLLAGRASAADPKSVFASQRASSRTAGAMVPYSLERKCGWQ